MNLIAGGRVTLDASGTGEVKIGPEGNGPQNWHITAVIIKTSRPGQAPIPKAQQWLNQKNEGSQVGLTYDGSFKTGVCDITMSRGQYLICEWTGGQSGDLATFTVTGDKW